MPTDKLDLYKLHKDEYVTPKAPVVLKTARGKYLTISGQGEPEGQTFQTKLGALYNVAYTVKMTKKFEGQDYKVCGLEGLWWTPTGSANVSAVPRPEWHWKLIIRTPDFVTPRDVKHAIAESLAKGKPADVMDVCLEIIGEGTCIQALHVGPYAAEAETIDAMLALAAEKGYESHGPHHEIYLSDPRRVAPERMRTILRMPVQKVKAHAKELAPA